MRYTCNENNILELITQGIFEIDSDGKIWRLKGGQRMKGDNRFKSTKRRRAEKTLPNGYMQIRVLINGVRYHVYAHRVVWAYFNGSIPRNYVINHKNNNKGDNRPSNLQAITFQENKLHAARAHGIGQGSNNSMSKLNEFQVYDIRDRVKNGESGSSLAAEYGVSQGHMNAIIHRRMWKHVV